MLIAAGFNLAKNFREKFLLSQRKFFREVWTSIRFDYIFYTFSLLTQLKIGRFVHLGRLFLPSRPVGSVLVMQWS